MPVDNILHQLKNNNITIAFHHQTFLQQHKSISKIINASGRNAFYYSSKHNVTSLELFHVKPMICENAIFNGCTSFVLNTAFLLLQMPSNRNVHWKLYQTIRLYINTYAHACLKPLLNEQKQFSWCAVLTWF